jgi:hypothetical protein
MTDPSTTHSPAGWPEDLLAEIAGNDDLHVAPARPAGGPRGGVPGTPTWIWSVALGDVLYVRPYRGEDSSWYRSAIATGAGEITSGGRTHMVTFTPADPAVLDHVDRAYHDKYGSSPYLPPMVAEGPRRATLRVSPAR